MSACVRRWRGLPRTDAGAPSLASPVVTEPTQIRLLFDGE
ncbi:hypothetical protein DB30_01400 [Enhygromyxa salina]|uniref:Uncharacterized protein n=1 Tax=Enhygromyxa salina TaxID=215803 RepID=A0A0C2D559_9BACT|nr:hypothetical protein DB30_01400 [Enhygromyxa salina]